MPSAPLLTSTLSEHTGLTADELAPVEPSAPLEPILPPEGLHAVRLRDVAARARSLGAERLDVAGVRGCAGSALASAIARSGRRVVYVTGDLDNARRAAQDAGFLIRGVLDDQAEETGEGE